jgi:pyruvate formate lyase activating enzyme
VEPLVAHVRRFALDDGPGIRATVFLKGCPLACAWCHNPECISPGPEPAPGPGREVVGEALAVEALVALLLRDRTFFEVSGGGVTLSGGEPTFHLGYAAAVARALRREGVHVALQTCGEFDLAAFRAELLPSVDLVLFDLKLADDAAHRAWTGRGNARIRASFRALAAELPPGRLVARVPLVPGVTATPANLSALGALVREAGVPHVLLPWNPGALAKRRARGEAPHPALPERLLSPAEEHAAAHWFAGGPAPGPRRAAPVERAPGGSP